MTVLLLVMIMFTITPAFADPVEEWGVFESAVRDQKIEKVQAQALFPEIYQGLKGLCKRHDFRTASKWVFPVQGYTLKDVGRGGFKPHIRYGLSPIKGYNFYDGNRHGGHPAYDIFIRDRNMDSLDDKNRKAVNVLAPVDLLILSILTDWQAGSPIRGGNYVWALDPLRDHIIYFAHLRRVEVSGGSFLKAGDVIGTIGRTGASAASKRSPTHLHLMVLAVNKNNMIPFDYWAFLK